MKNYPLVLAGCIFLLTTQASLANDCQITISSNDAMQFNLSELSAPSSCSEVTLTLTHTGKLPSNIMGHNWVLTEAENMQAVATDGMTAGIANGYLKVDDSRVIVATDIIGGGETTSVSFSLATLTVGKDYRFFCSFPGHWALMKGVFKVTE